MYSEQFATFEEHTEESEPDVTVQARRLPSYQPESPFLPEPEYDMVGESSMMTVEPAPPHGNYREAIETPFISEYEMHGVVTESAECALHREIMEALYDEEFEGAVVDLVNNVRGMYDDRFLGELGHGSVEAEQQMWMYLQPLQNEVEMALEQLIHGVRQIDNEMLTEAQLDNYLNNFEYETHFEQPEFEEFFKKLWKKAKKLAKKGLKVLKKLSPVHIVLGKLKKLVKPLLLRVLKFALNKVPARWRPMAQKLAHRFLKGALGEIEEAEFGDEMLAFENVIEQSELEALDGEMASMPPNVLATEFDSILAGYMIEGESYDHDPSVVQYLNLEQFEGEQTTDALDRARDRFIREIGSVQSEEEAIAQVENFIPAILMGLKLGIKLIGRRRVVNLLAKLVAKLIGKFVGPQAAAPLSRALVDAGLSLISLEAAEDLNYAAGEVVAETVQETVDEFVNTAPEDAYEDEELLELYVQEAFDHAVARNFPPRMLRPSLRPSTDSKGTWLLLPRGRQRKRYKKFTEAFPIKVTAQMAKRIKSFGGQSLYEFLKGQLGLSIDKQTVSAKMHLYEGIRGTSLSDISHLERRVEGLGSRDRSSWMQIHPLTPEAAGILIPAHVGLAQRTDARFLVTRTRTGEGQRFYFLEIPGAQMLRAPVETPDKVGSRRPASPMPARSSEVNATVDFQTHEIRIYDYLSEARSTEIAQNIRRGQSRVALVRAIRGTLSSALRTVISGLPGRNLTIRKEVQSEEGLVAGLAPVLRFVGKMIAAKITNFVVKELLQTMRKDANAFAQSFVKAAEANADGVTVVFTISRIGEVFDVFSTSNMKRVRALAHLRASGISGSLNVTIRPGFHKS